MAKYMVEYTVSRRVLVEAASKLEAAEEALRLEAGITSRIKSVTPLNVIGEDEDES